MAGSEQSRLTTVYVAGGLPEAQIIKGRLESEGIPVMLRYESVGPVYGLTIDGLGQVEIRVPSALAAEAKDILAAGHEPGASGPDQDRCAEP